MTDLGALLRILHQNEVEFIVIGGVAAVAHGSARLTQDLDVVYRRSRENYEHIVSSLSPYSPYLRGAPPGLPFRLDEETLERGLNFTLTTDLGPVDFLGEVAGGGRYEQLSAHSQVMNVFGVEARVVALRTLILLKRAAGRPKDNEAIAELEALVEEKKDLLP
jgi:predicted nucleotidyltransferase